MKTWNPLTISIAIAFLLQIAIIPWAARHGTLNWQAAPLYLVFTVPAGLVIILIGLVFSLIRAQ